VDDGRVAIARRAARVMSATQLEHARRAHEEIERLERRAARALSDGAPTTHRARLTQNRIVDAILTASVDRAKRLVRRSSDARVGAVSRARAAFGRARRAGRGERRRMGR